MARVPISFYLSIFAGIFVLFNHYAAAETGDVALNKVTGAADRFYTLFRDTALTFRHGYTTHLQTALCGPAVDIVLPHGAAEYIRVHCCRVPIQDLESVGRKSNDRHPHGGYGGSDFAFAYHQSPMRPLIPRTSVEGLHRQFPLSLDWSSQSRLSQAVLDRSSKAMVAIGVLLYRVCASWLWFKAPLQLTGVLAAAYCALSALGYLFRASMALHLAFQVYMVVVADFLQCMQWEAERRVLDIGVAMMEQTYGTVLKVS